MTMPIVSNLSHEILIVDGFLLLLSITRSTSSKLKDDPGNKRKARDTSANNKELLCGKNHVWLL